jgi:hypothetical protein
MWKEAISAWFRVLSRYFPKWTEQNHESLKISDDPAEFRTDNLQLQALLAITGIIKLFHHGNEELLLIAEIITVFTSIQIQFSCTLSPLHPSVKTETQQHCQKSVVHSSPQLFSQQFILTYYCNGAEGLIVAQPINKFPEYNGIRIFTTMFAEANLSWARWIQYISSHPFK